MGKTTNEFHDDEIDILSFGFVSVLDVPDKMEKDISVVIMNVLTAILPKTEVFKETLTPHGLLGEDLGPVEDDFSEENPYAYWYFL